MANGDISEEEDFSNERPWDLSPEELLRRRIVLLNRFETAFREAGNAEPQEPKPVPLLPNGMPDPFEQPMFFDTDILDDAGYQKLSLVGKLTWFALVRGAHITYHIGKPLSLDVAVMTAGFATILGRVLDGRDMGVGADELRAAGLIGIYKHEDRIPRLRRNKKGKTKVKGQKLVEKEVIHFLKYVSFVEPDDYPKPQSA